MIRAITALVSLTFCSLAWPQSSEKPAVDWTAINQQIEQIRAAAEAHDLQNVQTISSTLWQKSLAEWSKQAPTAADRLAQAEAQVPAGRGGNFSLPYLAMQAVQAGQYDKAQEYASQSLQNPSPVYDTIHSANIVLGLVALDRDHDVQSAKEYLAAAAKTKGSGILDRWGPNLALAKELLDQGESQAVLEYLRACKSFVTRNPKLDDWIALLKEGRAPNLAGEYLWHQ